MNKRSLEQTIIVLLLLIAISSPCLVGRGMFLDGTYYATIAKNLAFKSGSFWNLSFSQTLDKHFVSHMPLAIFLESLMFKTFGNHFWTEKIYSLITVLTTGVLTAKLWIQLTGKKDFVWLTLLIWISFPLTVWSVTNNVLENTMTVFVLLSVILFLSALKRNSIILSVLAGLSVFGAFMSKGPQGLFPLSLPVILFFFEKNRQNLIKPSVIFYLTVVLAFVILFGLSNDARNFLISYIHTQILGSIARQPYHFDIRIFKFFISQTAIPLSLTVLAVLFSKIKLNADKRKIILINVLLIIAGLIPFIFSSKQRNFYLIPLLPFAAVVFAVVFEQFAAKAYKLINRYKLGYLSIIISLSAIFFSLIFLSGKNCRDKDLLKDLDIIARMTNNHPLICVSKGANANWQLKAYLSRFYNISLTQSDTCEFFISYKYEKPPQGFEKIVDKHTTIFQILRKTK